jgi:hypothetical protein
MMKNANGGVCGELLERAGRRRFHVMPDVTKPTAKRFSINLHYQHFKAKTNPTTTAAGALYEASRPRICG